LAELGGADAGDIALPATPSAVEPAWVVLTLPKAVLVLTRAEFVLGLKRGKAWSRQQQAERRREV
jgi:hypothetical protein